MDCFLYYFCCCEKDPDEQVIKYDENGKVWKDDRVSAISEKICIEREAQLRLNRKNRKELEEYKEVTYFGGMFTVNEKIRRKPYRVRPHDPYSTFNHRIPHAMF
jgi:hypothetical protein